MLVLQSNVTPDLPVLDGGAGGIAQWIQPRLVGELPVIGSVEYAPYGAPVPGLGAIVLLTLAVLAVRGVFAFLGR